jgi:LacI family transcriptional regulator
VKERPTIRDVAARAGVSVATVSYVMNDKGGVGAGTRERVRAVAAALGYAPDAAARSLATRRTRLVGIVVGNGCGHPDLTVTFFGKVLEAIARRLGQKGYEALLLQADAPQPGGLAASS